MTADEQLRQDWEVFGRPDGYDAPEPQEQSDLGDPTPRDGESVGGGGRRINAELREEVGALLVAAARMAPGRPGESLLQKK